MQTRLLALVALMFVMLGVAPAGAAANAGALDPSFGNGGQETIHFDGADAAWGMTQQPDGKPVLVGQSAPDASSAANCAVARLNHDGSLDGSFGSGGRVEVSFGGDDACFSAAVQADGKLLVAGKSTLSGVDRWAIARLNSDGSLDPTFGTGGTLVIPFAPNGGRALSVLVQPGGGIIVTGTTSTTATQSDFTAVRLTSSGTIDTSFGANGVAVVDFGGDDRVEAAAAQPDGRIILAGSTTAGTGGHNFAVARLNPDGSEDQSFGVGGKMAVDFGGDDGADAVAVQPDGKILVTGDTTNGPGAGDFALARLNSDGTLDPSFGAGGKTTIDFAGGLDIPLGMALQPDGSAVLAGATTTTANAQLFAIARVTSSGALDSTFGQGGETTFDFGDSSVARAVVVQADGNILVDGVVGGDAMAVARLLGGAGGSVPGSPPPPCHGGAVAVIVREQWRCTRISGVDDGLLLTAADVPGYRAGRGGAGAADDALDAPALQGAHATGASFVDGKRRMSVGVFTLSSSGKAQAALRGVSRGRHRIALVRAVSGELRGESKSRSTDLAVAFQTGRAVGAVRLRVSGSISGAKSVLASYAKELAARLRRVLSLSAWARTVDGIRPDGSITPLIALQAFALEDGPVPGVHKPSGSTGPPLDGTSAIRMVASVWTKLTGAQKSAIDRDLGAAHNGGSASTAARASASGLTPEPALQALANKYNAIYRGKMPSAPPVTIRVFKATGPLPRGDLANSLPVNANGEWGGGTPAYCRVQVAPATLDRASPQLNEIMAHETFHCYQFVLDPGWQQEPQWVLDGTAEWAAQTVTGVDIGWLPAYFATVDRPLFSRTYDGVGFWGHVDEAGGRDSLWAKMPGILRAHDPSATFAVAGGTSPSFYETWGSAAWRFAGAGAAWNQTDPHASDPTNPAVPATPVSSNAFVRSQPYSVSEYVVQGAADQPLVEIIGSGTVRAGTTATDYGVIDAGKWFCMAAKCECPPDEESSIPPNVALGGGTLQLAVSDGPSAGVGQATYHSLDEFCKGKPGGGSGSGGGGGTGAPGLQVRSLQDASILGTINSGSCSFNGNGFRATGSGSGYSFTMIIANAKKPGQYTIPNNSTATYVKVSRGGTTYSTLGRNTTVLGMTGGRNAGMAIIRTRRVRVGKRTVTRYRIAVGIDDLVTGGHPGVALIPGPGGLAC